MKIIRTLIISIVTLTWALAASAANPAPKSETILHDWYGLVLQLVRHTPSYSPPVASRAFAYLGIIAFEVEASGDNKLQSLAGQLSGLDTLPSRDKALIYDDAVMLQAALSEAAQNLFVNTGPPGLRAMKALDKKMTAAQDPAIAPDVAGRSTAAGRAIATKVLAWAKTDGGDSITNLGFPETYALNQEKGHWQPTSKIALQQTPLLPAWGKLRTFAMPSGKSCPVIPPPVYSDDKNSAFFKEAAEVQSITKNLNDEQRRIARFWSDDPMLSPTPPGHWISIALQIFERDQVPVEKRADVLARLGMAMADAFIGCWQAKFDYDLLRPVTYIREHLDKNFEPLLITPPFPEYPSGHSTQSAAAAVVLEQAFGQEFAFVDATHARDGLQPRSFSSFANAAEEAALSRIYGGIHFRAAVEQGLVQGRCIGAYAAALKTRR